MAGPSITVRIFGDLQGLATSLQSAGSKAQGAAANASKSFGSFLGGLNKAGVLGPFGGALESINGSIGEMIDHAHGIGPAMIGAGAAITGVGALLSTMGSKDKAAQQQLRASIEATGGSYETYAGQIEETIKHQEKFGTTANTTQDALRTLVTATNSTKIGLSLMNEAADLAAAKHISLSEAAGMLGKVYNGNTKVLKQFGIQVAKSGTEVKAAAKASDQAGKADKAYSTAKKKLADLEAIDASKKKLTTSAAIQLRNAQDKVKTSALIAVGAHQALTKAQEAARLASKHQHDAVDILGKKLSGQASAQANTFTGHIHAMTAAVEDQVAKFGAKYGPALQMVGIAIMAMSTMYTTLAAAEWASLGPILLIVAAVAALVVVGYLLYKNWRTIWNGIQVAIGAVWNWIKTYWPMLLAILTGPIGIAVLVIVRNWDKIKAGAAAAVNGIKVAWNALVSFFTGLGAGIANAASSLFHGVTSAATTAVTAVQTAFNGMVSWVRGLPGQIASAAVGMFHGFPDALGAALQAIKNAWNAFPHFKMPSFDTHIPGVGKVGGFDVGLPHLAQGGLITKTGIVYAHAGEAISPIPHGAMGPAVHVEHAYFAEALDIDVFMRKAAWTLQKARV